MQNKKIKTMQNFIGVDIFDFVEDNYSKEYSDILRNIEPTGELLKILQTCKHNKDSRTVTQYAQQIILDWVLEDYIIDLCKSLNGIESVTNNGIDSERKFLTNTGITTEADIKLEKENPEDVFYIEVISDYNNFWNRSKKADLRDNKLVNLIEKSKRNKVCIMALDLVNKKWCFIPIKPNMEYYYIEKHPIWNKKAYSINLDMNKFRDIELLKKDYLKNAS